MAYGIQKGQTTHANRIKPAVLICFKNENCSYNSDNQTTPSANCCSPKNSGIQAMIFDSLFGDFFKLIIPTVVITADAVKLASGEKHIKFQLVQL